MSLRAVKQVIQTQLTLGRAQAQRAFGFGKPNTPSVSLWTIFAITIRRDHAGGFRGIHRG